jgi:hypothetical protein
MGIVPSNNEESLHNASAIAGENGWIGAPNGFN